MAFVVEDGTGLANATAYIDGAFATTYHADRGNSSWASASLSSRQAAIINATSYIDIRFGQDFIGIRKKDTQALEWPRFAREQDTLFETSITQNINTIPNKLKQACAEYALIAISATIAPNPEYEDTNRLVTFKKEVVGPIEEEVRYSEDVLAPSEFRMYPLADNLLRVLLSPSRTLLRA